MEEGFEKLDDVEKKDHEEIYSKAVRAGKRTYFFDVKATKKNDYYLTITESKKRFNKDGRYFYEKHKIFLYKEDFEKFAEGLNEVVEYIKSVNNLNMATFTDSSPLDLTENFADVHFDDFDNSNLK